MKGSMQGLAVFCFLAVLALSSQAQKVKSRDEDDSNELSTKRVKDPGMRGGCSCRDMQAQIDLLEGRLDRMIELWNDFVDKNREPYDQGGIRRPPQNGGGGRPPYYWDDMNRQQQPGRPGERPGRYMDRERDRSDRGRDMYDDNPRRFRF